MWWVQYTHRAVVILWADITAFLAPVDLEGATAADLTHSLMGSLVHACQTPDITWIHIQELIQNYYSPVALRLHGVHYLADMVCSL